MMLETLCTCLLASPSLGLPCLYVCFGWQSFPDIHERPLAAKSGHSGKQFHP